MSGRNDGDSVMWRVVQPTIRFHPHALAVEMNGGCRRRVVEEGWVDGLAQERETRRWARWDRFGAESWQNAG